MNEMYFDIQEEVRYSFKGIVNDLFDKIHITAPINYSNGSSIQIELKEADHLFKDSFKFLANSVFNFRPFNYNGKPEKKPWGLEAGGDFGNDSSVSAKTARLCVLAVIQEKRKNVEKILKDLKHFPKTKDYVFYPHVC